MRTRTSVVASMIALLAIAACGIDSKPGPKPPEGQAEYEDQGAATCQTMNGRAYAISMSTAGATDTLVFAADQMEALGRLEGGFPAAPYACSGDGDLLITADMRGDSTDLLRWSATISGDAISGTVTFVRADTLGDAPANFTGTALPGTSNTLRTPQRQVERL